MKNRIISIIAIAATAISYAGTQVLASEIPKQVEISFKVGDNILSVNKKDISVEKPFIAGDGVTMVPLRVITEAFGAEVKWDGETRSITIIYPDVTLGFTVGSKSVTVNDHTEQLEEAPVILGDGTTMVPLRFISETFGAEVAWDAETGGITVTKTAVAETGSTVQAAIDKEYITDSYYGWSMKNPSNFTIDEISSDCRKLYFINGSTKLYVDILKPSDTSSTLSLDKVVTNAKKNFSNKIISKAAKEKNSNGDEYAVIQYKDEKQLYACYIYIVKDCFYAVTVTSIPEDKTTYTNAVEIAETFTLKTKTGDNTEDISNVKNGIRHYKNTMLGLEFDAPAQWYELVNEKGDMVITSDSKITNNSASINAYFFSKNNNDDAKISAQQDRNKNKVNLSAETSVISDVQEKLIDGKQTYYYTCNVTGTKYDDMNLCDLFIENGDYVINLTIQAPPSDNIDIDAIVNSIKLSDIDSDEVGTVMRTIYSDELMLNYALSDLQIKIPELWVVQSSSDSNIIAIDASTGNSLTIGLNDYDTSISLNKLANSLYSGMLERHKGSKSIKAPAVKTVNGQSCYTFIISFDNGESLNYMTSYAFAKKGKLCVIAIVNEESMSLSKSAEDIETIINNMEW